MKYTMILIPLFGLSCLFGCESQTPSKPTGTSAVEAENVGPQIEDLPVVERAEYANWNQFPLGTVVKHVRETKSDTDKVVVTTTARLASKSAEKVVIETQITVDRGGEPLVNPVMELEYSASFRLPPNMNAAQFALPSQNAKVEGAETVEFEGKKYATTIYVWDASSEAGPTKNKMWFSNEIPGRVLRHEMTCSAFSTSENVTEIEIPKT